MKEFFHGARVCFVGDSITAANGYLSHIASFYRRNLKEREVKFFNCGVAGGALKNTINTYDIDIGLYNPTHIVLTIGVNDSERTALLNEKSEERYDILNNAYESFKATVRQFYLLTKQKGVELIICTPPPCAEYQENAVGVLRGSYALMLGYANFFRDFAKENGLALCDYHKELCRLIESEELFGPDTVHPNEKGHLRMAQIFLQSQGLSLDSEEIDESLAKWCTLTSKLRKLYTTQYLALPEEHYKLTEGELIARMKERLLEISEGRVKSYATPLAITEYLEERCHLDEYVKGIIGEMEN